jgi:hypothetical protein
VDEQGYRQLASAVGAHPLERLSEAGDYATWSSSLGLAERIVAYADKRVGQRLMTVDDRLDDMARRYPEHAASIETARPVARDLEIDVCRACRIDPAEVARDAWAADLLAGQAAPVR